MKKTCATFFVLLAIIAAVSAQSITIDLSGGYCAPIAPSQRALTATEYEIPYFPNYYSSYEEVTPVSFGQGGCIALDVNWYSKKDFGFGVKLNAQIGSSFTHTATIHYLDSTSANITFTDMGFSFQFIPHLSFRHEYKVVSPVIEMGMIIGAAHYYEDYDAVRSTGDVIHSSVNHSGGAMLGFYSSLGLQFKVSRLIRLSLAMNCSVASYSPTGWTRTAFIYNGSNQLANLYPSSASGVYVSQLNTVTTQSQFEPSQDLKFSLPFSNVGFTAGIVFNIDNKHSKGVHQSKKTHKELETF